MIRILGIDPGSRITGYGVIDSDGIRSRYVASGCVRTEDEAFPQRLGEIFQGIQAVVHDHHPEEMAVEQVFVAKNASSALKLGQARGAAICAGVAAGLPVTEYTPRTVKLSVVGSGAAEKGQVAEMVRVLLRIERTLVADEADALAVALSHAHTIKLRASLARSGR